MLDEVSPIDTDCGLLCGAACCNCDNGESPDAILSDAGDDADFEMGIYLLPGEEQVFTGDEEWLKWGHLAAEDFEFPESWSGDVHFLECLVAPHCPREKRPLQCRFFPLTPHLDEDGFLTLIYQPEALPYECPLITEEIPLNQDFIEATFRTWTILIEDPLIYDLVEMDSQNRIEEGVPIKTVWP